MAHPSSLLKPVSDGLWVVDGPEAECCGHMLPHTMGVLRLACGGLWLWNPLPAVSARVSDQIGALGPVKHLVAANESHARSLQAWMAAFPGASAWHARAANPQPPDLGQGLNTYLLSGLDTGEAVFFHEESRTLFLTDLLIALDTSALPALRRPLIWLKGLDDTAPRMPRALRRSLNDPAAFADDLERLLDLRPRRMVLAHGRRFDGDCVGVLERAFRKILQNRRWERAFEAQKNAGERG